MFRVWFFYTEWHVTALFENVQFPDIAQGETPVSAMIAAETWVRKRPRQ